MNTSVIRQTGSRAVEGVGFAITANSLAARIEVFRAEARLTPTASVPATPTVTPSRVGLIYTSHKYWYTVEIPSGWRIDSADPDAVAIWDSQSGSTIWITVNEIDRTVYPTLDSYVASWSPSAAEEWTDFQILAGGGIRTSQPIQAYEHVVSYLDTDGTPLRGRLHWYLLGRYRVAVSVYETEEVWNNELAVFTTAMSVQASFDPTSQTSTEFGYSVAHPPGWKQELEEGFDYSAAGPLGGLMFVRVLPVEGFISALDYGSAVDGSDWDIEARGLVYPGRPSPPYRFHYTRVVEPGGEQVRWTFLITLGGGNAVWLWVGGDEDDWTAVEAVVDDILLRMAVKP